MGLLSVRIADNRQIDGADPGVRPIVGSSSTTLALEMARLAEQAKQTALAIESEVARHGYNFSEATVTRNVPVGRHTSGPLQKA